MKKLSNGLLMTALLTGMCFGGHNNLGQLENKIIFLMKWL